MNSVNYKEIKPAVVDPITNVTEAEYNEYLNEYLSNDGKVITMINPNLLALFMSIVGSEKSYTEDKEKEIEIVKTLGARK